MGRLSEAALAPPVRLLVDGRLVLLLLVLVGGLTKVSGLLLGVVLLAVPGNLVLLLRWGRGGQGSPLVLGTRFAAWDGVVSGSVLVTAAMVPGSHLVLAIGHLLLSAVMIGMIVGPRSAIAWAAPALLAGVLEFFDGAKEQRVLVAVSIVSAVALLGLGGRVARQVSTIERIAADLAEAQALSSANEQRLVLARDLHDTVAKSAAGLRMLAEAHHAVLEREGSRRAGDAADLLAAAAALAVESRAVLDELRSAPQGDLVARLAEDARTWSSRVGVDVDIRCPSTTAVAADASVTWHCQRALGELLTNIERHAGADHVALTISADEDLLLVVEDNGVGMPRMIVEEPDNLGGSGHYGLRGVRERVAGLGGTLHLTNREGDGVRAVIRVPLPDMSLEPGT
ncbi:MULTISPECIES: sensor histidine kinase [Actinomyces]|uniref:Histidine kinase domain-containing protein n=1 Tax=Actinomyces respiraculi TaxID=2744574 RepID=A0A7T0LKI9_9ACTO|nr:MULTISPECIES: ATP-binding protein [Actinomyces]QPL05023.1 hypothetical protein ID810_09780 [Actinomyces respiraculi]